MPHLIAINRVATSGQLGLPGRQQLGPFHTRRRLHRAVLTWPH